MLSADTHERPGAFWLIVLKLKGLGESYWWVGTNYDARILNLFLSCAELDHYAEVLPQQNAAQDYPGNKGHQIADLECEHMPIEQGALNDV